MIQVLHEGQFLRLLRDGHWEYVARRRSTGAGFIVATTDARELILVEQYRAPMRARTLELPAGIIADSVATQDETVEASALRELEEETGFRGTAARILTTGPVAAGLASEMGYFVRVSGLSRVHAGGGVDGEDIRVHLAPLGGVDAWLREREADGLLIDPRIYAALYFLSRQS